MQRPKNSRLGLATLEKDSHPQSWKSKEAVDCTKSERTNKEELRRSRKETTNHERRHTITARPGRRRPPHHQHSPSTLPQRQPPHHRPPQHLHHLLGARPGRTTPMGPDPRRNGHARPHPSRSTRPPIPALHRQHHDLRPRRRIPKLLGALGRHLAARRTEMAGRHAQELRPREKRVQRQARVSGQEDRGRAVRFGAFAAGRRCGGWQEVRSPGAQGTGECDGVCKD